MCGQNDVRPKSSLAIREQLGTAACVKQRGWKAKGEIQPPLRD